MSDNTEYIHMLKEAQEQLRDAITTMKHVQQRTHDGWAKNYIVAPIEIATSEDHDWVTHDPNIDEWIEKLEGNNDETDDDETDNEEPASESDWVAVEDAWKMEDREND